MTVKHIHKLVKKLTETRDIIVKNIGGKND